MVVGVLHTFLRIIPSLGATRFVPRRLAVELHQAHHVVQYSERAPASLLGI